MHSVCYERVWLVEEFSANGKQCLNCLCQPMGQAQFLTFGRERVAIREFSDPTRIEARARSGALDSFEFPAIPSLNKALVLELARCEFIERKENVLALGNSGTGETHLALALGLAACHETRQCRIHLNATA
jgi:DNA replication protein DnaC